MGDFGSLAVVLERQQPRLALSVQDRLCLKAPGLGGEFRKPGGEQIGKLVNEVLSLQLRGFRDSRVPERCPEDHGAIVTALRRSVDLELILHLYHCCQAALWQAWFDLVEEAGDLDPGRRREELSRGSDCFFSYTSLLSDCAAATYQRELSRPSQATEGRQIRAIRAILGGLPTNNLDIDLDLQRHHLGLIAWGKDPVEAARQLARELERPLIVTDPPERAQSCWAWISGTRPLDPAAEGALASFKPATARVALGVEAFGERGFRATHRQAQRARLLAPAGAPTVTRYADIAVEALVTENEQEARSFVERELGAIGDDSTTSRRIRETLSAYFAAEHNAASAAATLGIHQQTVANRLRAAEERLGHPVGARRVELEVALRLRASLAREDS